MNLELVKQAKESLGIQAADIIARGLNLNKCDSRNLKGCCPIHMEKTPSFTWNKKSNSFKCFGCGATLDIIDYYIQYCNMNFIQAAEELFKITGTHYDPEEINRKKPQSKDNKTYRYPTHEVCEERGQVEKYMATRGISVKTLDSRDIKQDSKGNIVFEYKNEYGKLLTVKYRPSRKVKKGEIKTWCQKDRDTEPVLFGMDKIDITKPLLICEGEIDSLAAIESGFSNAVSVPFGAGNYHWIEYNWDWLNQFEKIIIWSDNDEPGINMRNEVIPRLGEYRCYYVESKYNDINIHLFKEGKESVIRAIEMAKEVPIKDVTDLSDVADFDINKAEKISSGLNSLNKWISGFVIGTLDVITGINSSGKSTLINQMCICEPLDQGYKTFIFSAELTRPQLRSWIEFPMAGPNNVKEIDNGLNKPKGYYVSKIVKEKMRQWYKNKIFVYNNDDDNTASSILKKMEELARRYGVKNFVLDNLMSIDLECNEYETLKKQKEFTLSLKRFARKFNAVIHLVAHPRKTQSIQRLTKMDIAGSGDITNLADYVMAIHRVTPNEKEEGCLYDCIVDLFKNRPIGHQDKEIGIYYDNKSKRFYNDADTLERDYKWVEKRVQTVINLENECPF